MYDIITFGSATEDVVVKPKQLTNLKYCKTSEEAICFPFGSKIDVDQMMFNSGGGGTNTAATFALQGLKTAYCGMIGNDIPGQEIIKELKKLKVDTRFVVKTDKKQTNHSIVILSESQDRTILAYRGAAELLDEKTIPWKKLKTKWIYLAPLSGLLCDPAQRGQDPLSGSTIFEDIVDFAKKNNIKIAINPGLAQLSLPRFVEIAAKIDVLFLNQEEASFLTKIPFAEEEAIFKKIDEFFPNIVVMTKGSAGVLVSDGKSQYSAKPNSDRVVVDTTGAGDSFASGFLSEFMRTFDIEKSIQLGMANSEGCLSEVGAKHGLLKKGQAFKKVEVMKSN